ncbi:hypothetical protein [Pseudoduganella violacea]|uniref:Uncharacterized protein n=1 Tax=Pseudoduganella violacea TaxID=1715466 RepID=A0A7W5BFK4_9BURK|nr:hypothetical protein [Pseudoduganella violacea]MBB3122207.1 hypothetical protein [Pseudoduganella violacea]
MAEQAVKEDGGSKQSGAFAVFDKFFELKWVVRVSAAVLFAETALMLVKGASLYSFKWESANWAADTGNLLLAAVALGLTVSAVLPIGEALISFGIWYIRTSLTNDREVDLPNYVKIEQLREKADREQSAYLLAKVKEKEASVARNVESMEKAGNASFQCLVLYAINHYVGQLGTQSSIQHILNTPYHGLAVAFLLCVGLILLILCWFSWWREYSPAIWIKDVELYEELQKQAKEKQDRLSLAAGGPVSNFIVR